MTNITLIPSANGSYTLPDGSILTLSPTITSAAAVQPPVITAPPPPAPNVAFTASISATGVISLQDVSLNIPVGATGSVLYDQNVRGSIRLGASASWRYATQGTYTVTLSWRASDGTVYSASGTVVYDGQPHDVASDPGTTVTQASAPVATAPTSTTPVSTAPPVVMNPPPLSPQGTGAHVAVMTLVDGADKTWTAQGNVGDDTTAPAVYCAPVDADGNPHPGITAWFYADCCEAGATRIDNAYGYLNFKSITVTYDGVSVPVPKATNADGTYDFQRGTRCPPIRYGKQSGWSADKIDWSLLPSFAKDVQAPWDDSTRDYSFNGLGVASTFTMGQGGSRPDLGYMSVWNMAFLTNPSDATWAVVRRADDWDSNWPVFWSDPETGHIVDMYKFPGTAALPYAQIANWANNAMVAYLGDYDGNTLVVGKGGPRSWEVTGSKFVPNGAHLTSYALLAAMITGTARDRDHASFWSNYTIIEIGVPFTMNRGCAIGAQRRFAWCLRNLFMASYVSSDTAYFAKEVARNLPIAMAHATNPVGLYDVELSYPRVADADGGSVAAAPWMQAYLAIVLDAVSHKLPEWLPFAQFLGKFMAEWGKYPFTMLASIGSFNALDPTTRTTMDDFPAQAVLSLQRFDITAEQAQTIVSAATVEDCYNAYKAAVPTWEGKFVDGAADFIGYLASPDAYTAMAGAAMVAAVNAGVTDAQVALDRWNAMPTQCDFSKNGIFHLVPRAQ